MIDIFSFNKSLKGTWIKKYLDVNNKGSWKIFFDLEFRQFGGDLILYGNLHKSDILSMSKKKTCPFVKEILEIWSDLFFYEKITSEEVFSTLPLWHNSLIRIGNKPVFYKDWYLKGITKVKHLYGNSADLLSWTDFKNKYNLKV